MLLASKVKENERKSSIQEPDLRILKRKNPSSKHSSSVKLFFGDAPIL